MTAHFKTRYVFFPLYSEGHWVAYGQKTKQSHHFPEEIHNTIGEDFSAYYINLSYAKIHNFKIGDSQSSEKSKTKEQSIKEVKLPTKKLAQIYAISPTPTIVLANAEGQTILQYPSYLPPVQFRALLGFITSGKWREAKDDEKKLANLVQQELQKAFALEN